MIGRRAHLIVVLCLRACLAGPAWAQAPSDTVITPGLESAVESGLSFLAQAQQPDGRFEEGPRVAMTGLAVMSFLAAGHTPDAGKYGPTVRKAVDWLIAQAPPDGYFGRIDGSRMYGHGIVTLALCEAYGVEPDAARRRRMHDILVKSIKVILDSQAVQKNDVWAGGWRYEPQSGDSDLSLSGWNTLALRAARNIGLEVRTEAVSKAVGFVMKCYREHEGGFAYQPGQGATEGMTGVAVLNLYLLAGSEKAEVQAAVKYLREHQIQDGTRFSCYGTYYATQAAFQAGGATWDAVWANSEKRLLASQMPDGGWPQSRSGEEPGRTYATTMAVLTLSVPYRLLPIYQR
jgi:hypothetical protein